MRALRDALISERLVMSAIAINSIALFLHGFHSGIWPSREFWFWVDYACVIYFLLEVVLKVGAFGWSGYWRSAWNRFDLFVVLVSLPVLAAPVTDMREVAILLVLRMGRLFRLFRVLRFIPNQEHLVAGIRRALRAAVGVFLALILINLVLALGATYLFGDVAPERFGNPLKSSYAMFQVFTVEGWHEIPQESAERACAQHEKLGVSYEHAERIGSFARAYFVFAVVVGGLLGISLANAVFVDEMMMDNTESLERRVDALLREVRELRERLK